MTTNRTYTKTILYLTIAILFWEVCFSTASTANPWLPHLCKHVILTSDPHHIDNSSTNTSIQEATSTITKTFSTYIPMKPNEPKFLVHGWRWHTLSLIRDLSRLGQLAKDISSHSHRGDDVSEEKLNQLESASSYVIDFNMKALPRIEEKTFFPWLCKRFLEPSNGSNNKRKNKMHVDGVPEGEDFQQAFRTFLTHLDQERNEVWKLGQSLVSR